MLVSYICFFVRAFAQTSVFLPRHVCAKDPPGPVCVSCAPPPRPIPPRTKPSHKGPFAAYWHSAPAALTVTRVNKLSGLFFGEGGLLGRLLSLCGRQCWQTTDRFGMLHE